MFARSLAAALAFAALPALAQDPGAEAAKAYALDTSASTRTAAVGEGGKLVVVIRPTAPGWHVHPQAPLKIRFEGGPGLRLEKAELGRKDAVDVASQEPRFEAPFVARAAGKQEAKANVDFFICSDTACVKQTKTVAFAVGVK